MIDATKSPLPAWKRLTMVVALVALIAVAGYVIWTKELHHKSAAGSSGLPPAAAATPSAPGQVPAHPATSPTSTTVPGGIPVSSRNPFGS